MTDAETETEPNFNKDYEFGGINDEDPLLCMPRASSEDLLK